MLGQGLTLTIIGMGIVIVFLALLVVLMVIMSGIVRRLEKRKAQKESAEPKEFAQVPPTTEAAEEPEAGNYEEIAAAIGAYLRAGGVLPAPSGDQREDVAAVLAAVAAAGGPVPKGNYNEIAAAIAAVRAYK